MDLSFPIGKYLFFLQVILTKPDIKTTADSFGEYQISTYLFIGDISHAEWVDLIDMPPLVTEARVTPF